MHLALLIPATQCKRCSFISYSNSTRLNRHIKEFHNLYARRALTAVKRRIFYCFLCRHHIALTDVGQHCHEITQLEADSFREFLQDCQADGCPVPEVLATQHPIFSGLPTFSPAIVTREPCPPPPPVVQQDEQPSTSQAAANNPIGNWTNEEAAINEISANLNSSLNMN